MRVYVHSPNSTGASICVCMSTVLIVQVRPYACVCLHTLAFKYLLLHAQCLYATLICKCVTRSCFLSGAAPFMHV
jgi:hypothetical protein